MADDSPLISLFKYLHGPTFGLEPGGTMDRSVGEGLLKDQNRIPGTQSRQMQEAQGVSDAVPRSTKPINYLERAGAAVGPDGIPYWKGK